jgi:hypothetical protein
MRTLTLVFLFFCKLGFASFDMNENMQRSYSHIVNLEFEKANILLAKEQSQNPQNGFIPLYNNYIDFLTILITEDFDYFELHKDLKAKRLDLLDNYDNTSPYYLYAKAEINLQWAFSRLKFEQYVVAAYEILKAYKLLEENKQKFPDFTLNNKGLGLIHALLGAAPRDLHWIINLAGLEGSITMGFKELDEVLNDRRFVLYQDEILFLLSFLQINLGNNEALFQKYLDRIGNRYEDNLLLNFTASRLLHNLGRNDDCLFVLQNRINNNEIIKFYYLDYLEGMSYFYMLDLKNAKRKFEYFVENFRGVNYIKSANHKLACIALLQNDDQKRLEYLQKVILDGNTLVDEDKVALNDAKRKIIIKDNTHDRLLRTRLLYDGGYYEEARLEISFVKTLNRYSDFYDEYFYRLARIESKLSSEDTKIINYYQKAYEMGRNSTNYYAPMSALQIGLIYESKRDTHQAESYFRKCLAMSGFDY